MLRKVIKIRQLVFAILILYAFSAIISPIKVMALNNSLEKIVNQQEIGMKRPGDQVTIEGTTTLDEVTVKVLRPNNTVMYVNAIIVARDGRFKDTITLPENAQKGEYTVIVGKGDTVAVKTFEVENESLPELRGLRLSSNQISLKEGKTYELRVLAIFSDETEKDVTGKAIYETSDSKVATIDEKGIIKAIGVGNATITITYEGMTATCKVTVTKESKSGGSGGGTKPKEPEKPKEPGETKAPEQTKEQQTPTKKTFTDIADYPWAKEAIESLSALGIIHGTSATTFEPGREITRAEFITLLIRMLKLEDIDTNLNFDDVDKNMYYYNPIRIARELGIVQGTGENKFNPDTPITREDMIVMVVRALILTNRITITGTFDDMSRFGDASQVSDYAIQSVATLVREGVIVGNADNTINPKGYATRAEIAVMLYRIYNKFLLS